MIGLNCSVGPKAMLETIERMMAFTSQADERHAQRRACRRASKGRNIYLCSPEYMAQYARRLLWAGVRIVGGCCGTTPEHIKLIRSRNALAAARPARTWPSRVEEPQAKAPAPWPPVPVARKSQLGAKLAAGKFVAFVEILPPRGVDATRGNRRRAAVRQRTASTAINVPDGPRASARMSAQVTCQLIQQQAGIEAVHPFLLPRPQHSGHSIRTAGRARRGRAQPDLHHRRSAAHGHLSGRHGGVRRGRHRPGQHRQQPEPRPGYRRQSDGLANRAAASAWAPTRAH